MLFLAIIKIEKASVLFLAIKVIIYEARFEVRQHNFLVSAVSEFFRERRRRIISEFYCSNLFQLLAACYNNHLSKILCQGEILTAVKTLLDLRCVRSIYNKLSWYAKPIWLCEIVSAPKLFHLLIRKIVCWVFHLSIGEREVFPR